MNIQTKYPVVLVHGMMLKDFKYYRAFRKIAEHLESNGAKCYVTNQDGVGSIENNALQLKEMIEIILDIEKTDKVNIIAHSKGGLDSRLMIHKYDMGKHIASLTTLSTPHHGSKISSNLLKMPKWMAKIVAFWINLFYKVFKDKNPDMVDKKIRMMINGLATCGLNASQVSNEDLRVILDNFLNGGTQYVERPVRS